MKKTDNVDSMILGELRANSKRPIRELSHVLQMHPNTLLQRIKRLEKNGLIRGYFADVDYKEMGLDIHAIIMIKMRRGVFEGDKYLTDISRIPEVESLYSVMGSTDCVATVKAKNRDDLVRVLKLIQNQQNVLRTNSHLVLVTYKEPHQFNPYLNLRNPKRH